MMCMLLGFLRWVVAPWAWALAKAVPTFEVLHTHSGTGQVA